MELFDYRGLNTHSVGFQEDTVLHKIRQEKNITSAEKSEWTLKSEWYHVQRNRNCLSLQVIARAMLSSKRPTVLFVRGRSEIFLAVDPICFTSRGGLCSKFPGMRSVGDTALNPLFRKSR